MEIRQGDQREPVTPLEEIEQHVGEQLKSHKHRWLSQLCEHPEQFAQVERQVHEQLGHCADELTAALLAAASASRPVAAAQKKSWLGRWIGCGRRGRSG